MFTIIVGQASKAFSIWFIEARMSQQVTLRYQGAVAMPNRTLGRKVSRPTAKTLHSLVNCLPRASSLRSRCVPGDVILMVALEIRTSPTVWFCLSSSQFYSEATKIAKDNKARSKPEVTCRIWILTGTRACRWVYHALIPRMSCITDSFCDLHLACKDPGSSFDGIELSRGRRKS